MYRMPVKKVHFGLRFSQPKPQVHQCEQVGINVYRVFGLLCVYTYIGTHARVVLVQLDVAVDEILAAVDHLVLPLLPGEQLEAVLAFLGHLDVHQQVLLILDPVAGVPLLASLHTEVETCCIRDTRHCCIRALLLHLSIGAFPVLMESDYKVQQWSGHLELHVKRKRLFLLQLD